MNQVKKNHSDASKPNKLLDQLIKDDSKKPQKKNTPQKQKESQKHQKLEQQKLEQQKREQQNQAKQKQEQEKQKQEQQKPKIMPKKQKPRKQQKPLTNNKKPSKPSQTKKAVNGNSAVIQVLKVYPVKPDDEIASIITGEDIVEIEKIIQTDNKLREQSDRILEKEILSTIPCVDREITLPDYVQNILDVLEGEGYPTYVVGGAVRDYPLEPNDYDIVTTAPMAMVEKLFSGQGELVGSRHPVFHMQDSNKKEIQIGPLVSHTDYSNPEHVLLKNGLLIIFNRTINICADAQTRVLSCNALYYRKGMIFDPCGGLSAIADKEIRFISDPVLAIQNDPGFIFRIIRLIAKLDFTLDSETEELLLNNLSLNAEVIARLNHEVSKTLLEGNTYPKIFELFEKLHLLSRLYGFTEEEAILLVDRIEKALSNPISDESKILILWSIIVDKEINEVVKPFLGAPFGLYNDYINLFKEPLKSFGFIRKDNYSHYARMLALCFLKRNDCHTVGFHFSFEEHVLVDILLATMPKPKLYFREDIKYACYASQTIFHQNNNAPTITTDSPALIMRQELTGVKSGCY